MLRDNYEVSVTVNGQPVKEFLHEGKVYVEGREDTEYRIQIKNKGYKRVIAVVTIDGLSIIDGKPAGYDSPGYIVKGNSTEVLEGWRTSDDHIHKFIFSDGNKSYAARTTKNKKNLGVIGVAIFEERETYQSYGTTFAGTDQWGNIWKGSSVTLTYDPSITNTYTTGSISSTTSANTNLSSASTYHSNTLGTGFGDKMNSDAKWVTFDRSVREPVVFEIYYNSYKELEKIGIDLKDKEQTYVSGAQAFPRQYCEIPK